MKVALLVCDLYWIMFSFIVSTKKCYASLFFKVIPFFTGIITSLWALKLLGIVNMTFR